MLEKFFGREEIESKTVEESVGVKARKEAIETLKTALQNPNSNTAVNIKRAHSLIALLKERQEKEGADVSEELAEADAWKKSLEGEAANDPSFESKDKEAA